MAERSKHGKVLGPAWRMNARPGGTRAPESAWERELRRLGVAEGRALEEMEAASKAGEALRRFALRNAFARYVPEPVLEWLGVATDITRGVDVGGSRTQTRKSTRLARMRRETENMGA